MKTFSKEVREAIVKAQNGYCFCSKECVLKITDIHHKLPNTVLNNKKYPLFIQSPMNAIGLNQYCHHEKPHLLRITDLEAQVYEEYLRNLKGSKV